LVAESVVFGREGNILKRRNTRALAALFGSVGLLVLAAPALAAPAPTVTICHVTDSATNPFVKITVSANSLSAHAAHGDVIPAPATGCDTDLCPNIAGFQVVVPAGLVINAAGDCVPPDVCPNIAGDQATVPQGYIIDASGNCVPEPQPCNATTVAGGEGTTVTLHELGQAGPLTFQFDYDTQIVPDEITITYEGNVVFHDGPIGTNGTVSVAVNLPAGTSTQVEVTVTGPSGTAWSYVVNCPTTT
jgi:hypothetical protein